MTKFDVRHLNPEGLPQNPAFSQAVVVSGPTRTIYVGGQNAVAADGQIVGVGDLAAQTEQIYTNLMIVLEAAGATLHNIVKWTIYVVQGQDIRPALGVFNRIWGTEHAPPVITVAFVAGLGRPQFLAEIDAIAVVAEEGADGGRG